MSDTPAEIFATFDLASLQGSQRDLKQRIRAVEAHPMMVAEYQARLAEIEAELEVRARRRDAQFAGAVARTLMLLVCIGSLFGMSGCTGFATSEARNRQIALTALMAVDTSQTVTIGRSPDCLREANPLAFFGDQHPSPQDVLITGAVYATAHWLLASYLDRKAESPIDLSISATEDMARRSRWRFMRGLYQGLTMIGHGGAVLSNQLKGIRPFSSYECGRTK